MVNKKRTVTAVFAALADTTRRRILVRLSGLGEIPVTTLAKPFRISLPAVSRHLRVLENTKLIERRRQGRLHLIRARFEGLRKAQEWIAHYAAGWDFSFDALDRLLKAELEKEKRR